MSKSSFSRNKFDRIFYLLQNEIAFSILLALSIYKSLNLQFISKLVNRTPSTVIHHMKKLEEDDLIIIDPITGSKVGKYYKLTEEGREIIEKDLTASFDSIAIQLKEMVKKGEIDDKIINNLEYSIKGVTSLPKIFTQFFLAAFEDKTDLHIKDGKLFKNDIPLGLGSILIETLPINTPEQRERVNKLNEKILSEVKRLFEEFIAEEKKNNNLLLDEVSLEENFQFFCTITLPVIKIIN